jgi:peptide/nickel transport system substrate-binding protein
MADVPVLKEGEKDHGYRTLLWPTARGSAYALIPTSPSRTRNGAN